MASFQIPLISGPQSFYVTLSQVAYNFVIKWNDAPLGGWVLDIRDNLENNILMGIPLVTGIDLLSPYPYLGFGGQLLFQTPTDIPPDFTHLTVGQLFFVTP